MELMPLYGWDLSTALTHAKKYFQTNGTKVAMIFGVFLLIAGFVVLGVGLFKHSNTQQPVPYGTAIALIIVGGVLTVAGWKLYGSVAKGLDQSVEKMGGGGMIINLLANGLPLPPLF